jgi:hypothetical protein
VAPPPPEQSFDLYKNVRDKYDPLCLSNHKLVRRALDSKNIHVGCVNGIKRVFMMVTIQKEMVGNKYNILMKTSFWKKVRSF